MWDCLCLWMNGFLRRYCWHGRGSGGAGCLPESVLGLPKWGCFDGTQCVTLILVANQAVCVCVCFSWCRTMPVW